MIVPIMMLAIKESVMDMSPYVRKTAAHAIPKLYRLEFKRYILSDIMCVFDGNCMYWHQYFSFFNNVLSSVL